MDDAVPASQTSASTPDPAQSPDLSGKTLGDFRLLRRLGQGGMGQVYLAEQISLKRKVAVKIMRPDVARNATSYQRFRAEAEAIARITHTNIVQVYAFGEEAAVHYMALEYVEGRNLGDYVAKKGPPDVPLALSIMRQVAAALQRASELGIVHRDIKPENILLTRRGEVKVADFGLSRCFADDQPAIHLTQPGLTMGTPLYMSPEQIQGNPVDPRSDIYSFGITCYHMLTGQPPFRGQTALELAIQHVRTEPKPLAEWRPDLPPELCAVVHKMLAKEAEKRYQTCGELLKDLARLREGLGAKKTPAAVTALNLPTGQPTTVSRTLLPLLPSRWVVTAAALTILLALVGGGALAWMRNRSKVQGEQPVPRSSLDAPAPLTEEQKQERFMRDALQQFDENALEPVRPFGLQLAVDLGVFYLKHHRLDDADQFFVDLRDRPPRKIDAFRTLGQLGHAIVLARSNKAAESNRAFLDLLNKPRAAKSQDRLQYFLNLQPQFAAEIARALEYNRINGGSEALPKQLESLREPPRLLQTQPGGQRRGS